MGWVWVQAVWLGFSGLLSGSLYRLQKVRLYKIGLGCSEVVPGVERGSLRTTDAGVCVSAQAVQHNVAPCFFRHPL